MTEVHVFIKKNHNVSISDFRFCPVPHQILVTVFSFNQLKKMSYFSICSLLLFLLVYADSANSQQAHYYITPSLSVHCPGDPCLILPQLAANSTSYLGNETDISLFFLPGNHSLDGELSLSHADNFSMTKVTGGNGTVFVECGSQSGRFNISETIFAVIKDLHFIGCGGNKVSQVEQFIVEDTIFEGVEGRGTALVLNQVTDASIARSSFLSNTHGSTLEHHEISPFASDQEILKYLCLNRNSSLAVGGALYTAFSNVSIVSSKFTDNRAEIGGALFAHNSSLHVIGSTYSYNKASFAGVMITSGSSINIKNCGFIENAAMILGGVIIAYRDSFSIHGTTFTNNTAGDSAGVMLILDSMFRIIDSNFSGNAANNGFSGVIYALDGSFTIISSTFTNNSAADDGGVMDTYNSSFTIIKSTFTNNSAADDGGVMDTYNSSFTITKSTFTNNSAADDGGVMDAQNSSFNITSITFTNNSAADDGGVMDTYNSSFTITKSTFTNNSAADDGGVMDTYNSSFTIIRSTFTNNSAADDGGVMDTHNSSFNITKSTFTNNSAADDGGVMFTSDSSFNITSSTFNNNSAADSGGVAFIVEASSFGVIFVSNGGSVIITNTMFTNNSATARGGVMYSNLVHSSFIITNSNFLKNDATVGGVIFIFNSGSVTITNAMFSKNSAVRGGVMLTSGTPLNIANSTFTNNSAAVYGGVMRTSGTLLLNITSSTFTNNSAAVHGGVMYSNLGRSSFIIINSSFLENGATGGGVIFVFNGGSVTITNAMFTKNSAVRGASAVIFASISSLNIINSSFCANNADSYGGIMSIVDSTTTYITDGIFDNNLGSLYIFSSNITFSGYTRFQNGKESSNKMPTKDAFTEPRPEGGAVTSLLSTVIFTGINSFSSNRARHGGAILATESKIIMYGETTIANNTATNGGGGGISLQQSDLEIKGSCVVSGNDAVRGGGIHATSSTVAVHEPSTLQFTSNQAENGSGVYLEVDSKLNVLKTRFDKDDRHLLTFSGNHADYGGAIYVADDTNAGACLPNNECFFQTLTINLLKSSQAAKKTDLIFSGNTANKQGANLFGGLLDRCIPSPFSEVYLTLRTNYSGISYLENISNATALDTISSLPIQICFCNSDVNGLSEPDCSYQPPTIKVKKGEAFTVPLVAVDQVNHSVDASIINSLSSQDGGFSEGQQTQSVGKNCSNVTFNVFSPHNSETIQLFADGPCGSSTLSTQHLYIEFSECTCPVGFQPLDSDIRCGCDCDSKLSPHITSCNSTTKSLVRVNTNSWITHINDTDPPGYVIYPNCPLDYCQPQTENVSMNLNLPDGSDAQCAYNRSGVLCGGCQKHLSLSLGSSRCLSCHSHWPAVLIVILLAAIVAGILLVTALLALNMTVAVGLINGFIFYANIVAANSAIFFPSSEPSFPTVFVAWLNLDIGINVCFFDGLDAHSKTWLQLAFPVYIISLVIIMIIVSEYSPRFAGLIGKRDPVATLATLILLSYAKLLSVTITALSFAVLDYPDGSRETVWLPDGNVPYFRGKHVTLVLVALLIILVGVPYTILLLLWQWLVRAPEWKVFKWTRNTKFNAFISVYHAPYNSKYRYWTGLLLLVRVVLYITASVTVSADPQTSLLITNILVGSLFVIKEITGARVYKKSFLSIIETVLYFNLLALSAFSWYRFKIDAKKQTAVAYTSTIITFILLVGVIVYHVYLLVRKGHPRLGEEVKEYPLAPVQPGKDEVTFSFIEIPKPQDQSPPPEENNDQIEVK